MLVTYPVQGKGGGPVTIDFTVILVLARGDFGRSVEETQARCLRRILANPSRARSLPCLPFQRRAAQRDEAGRRAGGVHRRRILDERTAAALAYGLYKLKEKSKIAVFDLGGGTFDLWILNCTKASSRSSPPSASTRLGATLWTAA